LFSCVVLPELFDLYGVNALCLQSNLQDQIAEYTEQMGNDLCILFLDRLDPEESILNPQAFSKTSRSHIETPKEKSCIGNKLKATKDASIASR
jgi:hypothetical protein